MQWTGDFVGIPIKMESNEASKLFIEGKEYSTCESWTIKKAERQRIDAFKLVLEKTLESPLDSKEIQPDHPEGNQP